MCWGVWFSPRQWFQSKLNVLSDHSLSSFISYFPIALRHKAHLRVKYHGLVQEGTFTAAVLMRFGFMLKGVEALILSGNSEGICHVVQQYWKYLILAESHFFLSSPAGRLLASRQETWEFTMIRFRLNEGPEGFICFFFVCHDWGQKLLSGVKSSCSARCFLPLRLAAVVVRRRKFLRRRRLSRCNAKKKKKKDKCV